MRIQYIEMQTPAGIRSAYLALPDGAYDENWKSSSITILREDDSEQSVRRLIDEAGLQFIVDEQKSILGFPNPVDGLWHFDGGETLTDDEQFVQAFSCSALPGGAFLMLVDDLARTIAASEIPLGILTAFVGAPLFLYLIVKGGTRHDAD